MGLDYAYALLLRKSARPQLEAWVAQNSKQQFEDSPEHCVSLIFPLDDPLRSFIRIHMEDFFDEPLPHWRKFKPANYPDFFPTPKTGLLGCIYYLTHEPPDSEWMFASFAAPNTSMSNLFYESKAIRKTFTELGQSIGADAVWLDAETGGFHFCLAHGQPANVQVPAEWEQVPDLDPYFRDICQGYTKGFFGRQ